MDLGVRPGRRVANRLCRYLIVIHRGRLATLRRWILRAPHQDSCEVPGKEGSQRSPSWATPGTGTGRTEDSISDTQGYGCADIMKDC